MRNSEKIARRFIAPHTPLVSVQWID